MSKQIITIDDVAYKCMTELNNLKYCYESTISDCIVSVAYKWNLILTQDDKDFLKRKLITAMAWKSTLGEVFEYEEEPC